MYNDSRLIPASGARSVSGTVPETDRRSRLDRLDTLAAIFLVVALLSRSALFGDPFYNIDDGFYLLVGDRMLHGALPYVDIWDRKPIGLFLIYAAARALPGSGVLGYQFLSTVSVVATSLVMTRIARRYTDARGALGAGLLLIAGYRLLGGGGGQSPVFYELPVALAALLTLDRMLGHGKRYGGAAAMLLMGTAIQIKYSALFEGAAFGCALLIADRRSGRSWPELAIRTTGYAGLGLAPTVAAAAFYAASGHFAAFWYANFVSIMARGPLAPGAEAANLRTALIGLAPSLLLAVPALLGLSRQSGIGVLRGWTVAALASFASLGSYFDHYALPLIPPLAIAAATLSRRASWTRHYATVIVTLELALLAAPAFDVRAADRALARDMARIIRPHARDCLMVFSVHTGVYLLTGACGVTPYLFPEHLLIAREHRALGTNAIAELRRALASRPGTIIAGAPPRDLLDPTAWALLSRTLATRYVAVYRDRWHRPPPGYAPISIYLRRDLARR